jgi:3-oxoacyl-[acyl-carrier protein] reductase
MSDRLGFDGQVALITGGAAGLGKAYGMALAERGARIVVNGNYRESGHGPEDEVAADIRSRGGEAVGVNGSVTDEEAVRRMIAAAIDHFGRLDIVVNNAGTGDLSLRIQDAPDERFERQFDIHVRGPIRIVRAACRGRCAAPDG